MLIALQILFINVLECCIMKDTSKKPEYMVYDSKYVIFGTIVRKITPDPRTPAIPTSYGVEMDIICIYKGDLEDEKLRDKESIIIAGAGVVKEGCYGMDVEVDEEVVAFLNAEGNHLVPSYGVSDYLDPFELVLVCGMNPVAPRGQQVDPDMCPKSATSDCVKYEPPTTASNGTTTKMPVKVLPLTTKAPRNFEPEPEPETTPKEPKSPEKDVHTKTDPQNSATSLSCSVLCSVLFFTLSALLIS